MDASHSASGNVPTSSKRKERQEHGKERIEEYEEEGMQLWAQAKQKLLQPGVAGGLVGVGTSFRRAWGVHEMKVDADSIS